MASFIISRLKGPAAAGILRLPFVSPFSFGRRAPVSSAAMSTTSSATNLADESLTSSQPWLMLPPKSGENTVCKFYNLAEDRVESFGIDLPDSDDAVLVGSSHGWLAFFNRRNSHVFLSNPLSGRLLKLPSIDTVEDAQKNLRAGRGTISKLILSSSPELEDCRAMISLGPGFRPICYSPGLGGAHWTSLVDWFFENKKLLPDGAPRYTDATTYEDLVYCSTRKKFSLVTEFQVGEKGQPLEPSRLDDYDLHCIPGPWYFGVWLRHLMAEGGIPVTKECFSWMRDNEKLLKSCVQIPYLVFNEACGGLFILTRFLDAGPYKTVGFSVSKLRYNENGFEEELRPAVSLDGLAMFVGINHSFVVSSPAEFGLKPNSIYFTDAANARFMPPAIHGHDNGIFDYENMTVSPCPGPKYDDHETLSTPVWFTPSPDP